MVSQVAIVCMVIEIVLAFVIPISAVVVWKAKSKTSIVPVFGGVLTFILFVQILEGTVHSLLLMSENPFSNLLNSNFFLYALYGGLMAGVFEETGRYVTLKYALKKYNNKEEAISYGLGHGGIECIMALGLGMFVNLVFAMLANSGTDELLLLSMAGGSTEALESAIAEISGITPIIAGVAVLERVLAMVLHLCLSMVVFASVKKSSFAYFLAAVLLHTIADFGILMMSQYSSIYVAEAVLAVFVAGFAYYVFKVKRGEV